MDAQNKTYASIDGVLRKKKFCALSFGLDRRSMERLMSMGDCWRWISSRNRHLEIIRQGQGFWLYFEKVQVVEVSGEYKNYGSRKGVEYVSDVSDDSLAGAPVELVPGWNLAGISFVGDLPEISVVFTVNSGLMTRVEQTEKGYDLERGKGYWMFMQ